MTVNTIGDRLERWCAHWLALPIFTAAFIGGLLTIGVDATNIVISYLTVALLLLTLGGARRDRKAMHAKLDDLEVATPDADSSMTRLEEQSETEIDMRRPGQ